MLMESMLIQLPTFSTKEAKCLSNLHNSDQINPNVISYSAELLIHRLQQQNVETNKGALLMYLCTVMIGL